MNISLYVSNVVDFVYKSWEWWRTIPITASNNSSYDGGGMDPDLSAIDQFKMLMVSPQIKWLPTIVSLCKDIRFHLSLTTVLQIF